MVRAGNKVADPYPWLVSDGAVVIATTAMPCGGVASTRLAPNWTAWGETMRRSSCRVITRASTRRSLYYALRMLRTAICRRSQEKMLSREPACGLLPVLLTLLFLLLLIVLRVALTILGVSRMLPFLGFLILMPVLVHLLALLIVGHRGLLTTSRYSSVLKHHSQVVLSQSPTHLLRG